MFTKQIPTVSPPGAAIQPMITVRTEIRKQPKPRNGYGEQPSYSYHLQRAEETGRAVWKDYNSTPPAWRAIVRGDDGVLYDLAPLGSEIEAHAIRPEELEIEGMPSDDALQLRGEVLL